LAINQGKMTLIRSEQAQPIPADVVTDGGPIKVFDPKMPIHWQVASMS